MPAVENWLITPLDVVDNHFNSDKADFQVNLYNYYSSILKSRYKSVPFINGKLNHELKAGSFVRFRCMVQDHFGPEYFDSEVVNSDGSKVCGYFVDRQSNDNCVSSGGPISSRELYYCVSIPGETSWIKDKYRNKRCKDHNFTKTPKVSLKRQREDDEDDVDMEMEEMSTNSTENTNKKIRGSENSAQDNSNIFTLSKNHPIPCDDNIACIVKVYDQMKTESGKEILPNKVYEFYGILAMPNHQVGEENLNDLPKEMVEEIKAHSPPGSLIPRLHCLHIKEIDGSENFKLDPFSTADEAKYKNVSNNIEFHQKNLLHVLTEATLGDSLLAEYLLCNLVSRVVNFDINNSPVGKIVLNITNAPSNYGVFLAKFLDKLVPRLFHFHMSLSNMNKLKFAPKKNYDKMLLETGLLQIPDDLHLIVDETYLATGTLDETGVNNMKALSQMIKDNTVDYDFKFHKISFVHKPVVIVLSEGKSILTCDIAVKLCPTKPMPDNIDGFVESVLNQQKADDLQLYLAMCSLNKHSLTKDHFEKLQNDFVETRQKHGTESYTVQELSNRINLCKSIYNLNQNADVLKCCASMEIRRKERL